MIFRVFKDLAAHLKILPGTLVCRGTPVEKHCRKGTDTDTDDTDTHTARYRTVFSLIILFKSPFYEKQLLEALISLAQFYYITII